jgi:hypothetical protein
MAIKNGNGNAMHVMRTTAGGAVWGGGRMAAVWGGGRMAAVWVGGGGDCCHTQESMHHHLRYIRHVQAHVGRADPCIRAVFGRGHGWGAADVLMACTSSCATRVLPHGHRLHPEPAAMRPGVPVAMPCASSHAAIVVQLWETIASMHLHIRASTVQQRAAAASLPSATHQL